MLSHRTYKLVLSIQPFNQHALYAATEIFYAAQNYQSIIDLCSTASSSYVSDELAIFACLNQARCFFFLVRPSPISDG